MRQPTYSLEEIAQAVSGYAVGASKYRVTALAEPGMAKPDELALALSPAYEAELYDSSARAAVLCDGVNWEKYDLDGAILVKRSRFALAGISQLWSKGRADFTGIHPSAIIHPEATLGADVTLAPFTTVSAGATIGSGSFIGPYCYIGANTTIAENARLMPHVTIGNGSVIGKNFLAHSGVVIGADGFSFATEYPSTVDVARKTLRQPEDHNLQKWHRIHSLGFVKIADDVEIGANTTIDRGTLRETFIGEGTKIDNLVMVGHNTRIGRYCLICGQSGIAGSVEIGDGVVLGGQTGVKDHVRIGDHVIAGAGTLILSNVPKGRILLGNPAQPVENQIRLMRHFRRLGRLGQK